MSQGSLIAQVDLKLSLLVLISLCLLNACVETIELDDRLDMSEGSEIVSGRESPADTERSGDIAIGHSDLDLAGESAQGGEIFEEMMAGVSGEEMMAGEVLDCGEMTACGVSCADLNTDPNNCGGCGRTCLIPHATAACVGGDCVIDQCLGSYIDADLSLENGCELLNSCEPDIACMTSCGSEGRAICMNGITDCRPPEESCNLSDDDCDGACDESWAQLGCRVAVHRGYGRGEHIYSTELSVVTGDGHNLESQNYFYLYQETQPNSRPVFYCKTGAGRPFLSTQTDCGIGRAPLRTLGFWIAAPTCDASPLYFLTKNGDQDFFYTTSAAERDSAVGLGYADQGVVGYIWRP